MAYVFDARPKMLQNWGQLAKVLTGLGLFGLLVWAAIYELVYW